ncbi:phage holin family protein [Candidatus Gottesmanbacteria bacterium]|nr:phage holin family protein [Candidatus Gottesmanbacteria bacterium]
MLLVTTYIVPGFKIDSYITAFVVALVLGILNMSVKPILIFFTLPATIVTLGLFIPNKHRFASYVFRYIPI